MLLTKRGARFFLSLAALMVSAPAVAKTAVVTLDAPACTSWAGWHEWVQASLTAKGAAPNKFCPTYIGKGTKVEVLEGDDGEGAATVRWKGRTWRTHADRLRQ